MDQLLPGQAFQYLREHRQALFIDCCSDLEYLFVGRAAYSRVLNILHGFEGDLDETHHRTTSAGWRFEGLPWEQC